MPWRLPFLLLVVAGCLSMGNPAVRDVAKRVYATYAGDAAFAVEAVATPSSEAPYIQAFSMEPATGIEPATCGLRMA